MTNSYRLGIGIVICNKDKKIFAGKRLDTKNNAWQMPQGGIDEGEEVIAAMYRELYEETGIDNIKIIAQTSNWITYDLPENLQKKFWGGKYKGQKQKWFLVEFLGEESKINLKKHEVEFSEYKWETKDNLIANIIEFKQQLYIDVFDEFSWYFDK